MKEYTVNMTDKIKNFLEKYHIACVLAAMLALGTLISLILFWVIWPDNLMHSDMAAEVLLSKLLADEGGLLSPNWYYSTEIRIVYTHLIMTPLLKIFSDFGTVKLISIIFFDVLLAVVFYFYAQSLMGRTTNTKTYIFLGMALLLAPLSNEYLDMMFLGNFYTSQAICTFLMVMVMYKEMPTQDGKRLTANHKKWIRLGLLCIASLILGLSGLRYLASLFAPVVGSYVLFVLFEKVTILTKKDENATKKHMLSLRDCELFSGFIQTLCAAAFAFVGFLINKTYLSTHYSFDQTAVHFVPLNEVVDRFLTSIKLMIELMGYKEAPFVSALGIVNVVKFASLILIVFAIGYLTRHKDELLDAKQKLYLYYFYLLFLLNWYMLVFTDVLQQYRYWLPVYIMAIVLVVIFIQKVPFSNVLMRPLLVCLVVACVLGSLYGELWQDTMYNDCEKRYGYMEFLEKEGYEFGYATFWNSTVTEYLSNGTIHVANLGGDENGSSPYEWLVPKAYYQKGYHQGKTFLLLQVTEEPALFNGDITFMNDSAKVYEDAYYVIYEGEGMYLFAE